MVELDEIKKSIKESHYVQDRNMNLVRVTKKTMKKGVLKSAFITDKRTISINGENFIVCPGEITFHKNGNFRSFYISETSTFEVSGKAKVFTNSNYSKVEIVCKNLHIKACLKRSESIFTYKIEYR